MDSKDMTALDAIFTRSSIRNYTEEPISAENLETIIRAGMYAPSAHNTRTWEFITVENKETLQTLARSCKHWRMLAQAPLAIACCASETNVADAYKTYLIHNTCAAVENMLLAIHALGLGGVWLNASPAREHYEEACATLQLPEGVHLVAVLAVGHPARELPPRSHPDRYEPEKWRKEHW